MHQLYLFCNASPYKSKNISNCTSYDVFPSISVAYLCSYRFFSAPMWEVLSTGRLFPGIKEFSWKKGQFFQFTGLSKEANINFDKDLYEYFLGSVLVQECSCITFATSYTISVTTFNVANLTVTTVTVTNLTVTIVTATNLTVLLSLSLI